MFALDYVSSPKTESEAIPGGNNNTTGTGIPNPTPRLRSNSMTSSVSDGHKIKPPHTEGHIKWLTTM